MRNWEILSRLVDEKSLKISVAHPYKLKEKMGTFLALQ